MKINSKKFRVLEGIRIDLTKLPTTVAAVYESKKDYKKLPDEHVERAISTIVFNLT